MTTASSRMSTIRARGVSLAVVTVLSSVAALGRCLPRPPLPIVAFRRSALGDVDDRLGEGPRCLLRQVVADAAGDDPMLVPARELPGVGARLRVGRAVGV